jgi:hypothetical protein
MTLMSGGRVDAIFGFEMEADALDLEWIKEKSQVWVIEQKR